ncbi:excalibur calcium-binding domain-containing protein [Sphingorhabdus sp. EL138]|uniref:excalibur calcium-binding domain-containing protein n=1 Tax=Sphingorhabdus sp. EL138 TaxID=2073156 RepID=UPI000D694DF1|nr:excalibur calcium-binding domain-containing protein [Sphingorhabdus sp. EL138]
MRFNLLIFSFAISILPLAGGQNASAHGGRTAADGCHNDRKNGGRHCHRGSTRPQAVKRSNESTYYPNCTAARNAGAAPVRRGQPGYGTHLDRDRDGIGCE